MVKTNLIIYFILKILDKTHYREIRAIAPFTEKHATDENDIVSSTMKNIQALFISKHRLIFYSDAQHIKIHILLSCIRILTLIDKVA